MRSIAAALLIILVVVLSSVMFVPQTVSASSKTLLTTNNAFGTLQNNFTVDGALFFGVYTNGSQAVTLTIVNSTGATVAGPVGVITASDGSYQSWVKSTFTFFDLTGMLPGAYRLEAYIGAVLTANASFALSYPVYSSKVYTTMPNYNTLNDYFIQDGNVYTRIYTTDQFGNPMSGNTSAGLQIRLSMIPEGGTLHRLAILTPNDYGYTYYSFNDVVTGLSSGSTKLVVNFSGTPAGSSTRNPETGSTVFYIIQSLLKISPYSPDNTYGQGTILTLSGVFAPFSGKVNFTVVSTSGREYVFAPNLNVSSGYWNYT
ncbi:MAG: hypothetical protein QXP70_06185, partial [Methanomassiliicoccales archaeon]